LYLNNITIRKVEGATEDSSEGFRILILGDIIPSVNRLVLK